MLAFYVFSISCGVFWTLTYILQIRQGFRDRAFAMPLVALGANLAWEFIYSFVHPHPPMQRSIDIVWLAFDVLLLVQLVRFGPKEFPDVPRWLFHTTFGVALGTSAAAILTLTDRLGDPHGATAAFAQNLMMSVLFIAMLYRRRSTLGQSQGIALCKMLGTVCSSLAYGMTTDHSPLMVFLYVSVFVFDLAYLVLLRQVAAGKLFASAAKA